MKGKGQMRQENCHKLTGGTR